MKTSLIILALIAGSAIAAEKKVDMRQGTKSVDEKYLETKATTREPQALQDRKYQLESKRTRQYEEERPVTAPYYNKKR